MRIWIGISVLVSLCATGCVRPAGTLVGADRDAHGCIGSAGYVWSQTLEKCIRPWEQQPNAERENPARHN